MAHSGRWAARKDLFEISMRISNNNQLRLSVIISYIQMAAAIVISIVFTPYALKTLGDNEYGLLQTANSTVAMLSVLMLGFNSSYIRYYARYKQAGDQQAIYKLNGLFLILFCVLGSLVLGCGLFLAGNLELVFDDGLTVQEYATGRILLIITTFTLALSFPRVVFSNIISAHERYVFLKTVAMVESIGGPLLNFAVLYIGYRSVALSASALTVGIVVFLLYGIYALQVLKQKFIFRNFEKGLLGSLFRFAGFIAINLIVDQVNNQVDKVLLARFCGTAVVAVYAVGINFSNYYTQFSTAISGIFTPRVHQMVISTEHDPIQQRQVLTAFFTKVGRMQFLLLALVASGFVLFGQQFLNLWVGSGYRESYYVALACMLPGTIPLIQNVGIEIQRAENRHHYRSVIYGIIAAFNVAVTIYLCQIWGAAGAALGTGMACILGHGLIMNVVYHKQINIDVWFFWKNILRQLLGMVPAFAVGIWMAFSISIESWLKMLVCIVVYMAAYLLSILLFALNGEERNVCRKLIEKISHRGHV